MTFINCCGYAAVTYAAIRLGIALWNLVYPFYLAKRLGLLKDIRKLGEWAVVTGATDGIGKAYAEALVQKGWKVVLLSRSEEKLKTVANELKAINSHAEIRIIQVDFSTADVTVYDHIEDTLKQLNIGILVNNVGVGYDYPEYFVKIPGGRKFIANMLHINCMAGTMMSHMILPGMLERKRGTIINVTSAASLCPRPLLSLYSASKIYMDHFSRGLNAECRGTGVSVQVVCPFFVVTKMSKLRRSTFWTPNPREYANTALDTVGILPFTLGCVSHTLQFLGESIIPDCIRSYLSFYILDGLRRKALKAANKGK